MNDPNVIIKLPDSPEEIGVLLPPAQLRRIDFSALDFEKFRRLCIEYTKTYYPDEFNDFVLNNGVIMLFEVFSAMCDILSERSDIIADESFLPTAQSRTAVRNHLNLIGQHLLRLTPAIVEVECSLSTPAAYDVNIPPRQQFSVTGPNGETVVYELFRSVDDYESSITIPRGKRGIIGYAVQGSFLSTVTVVATGDPNQVVDIINPSVFDDPIIVKVISGEDITQWTRIDFIEKAESEDQVFEVRHLDDRIRIIFGDNENGKSPISGQIITVDCRTGVGISGRIGRGIINESRSISSVNFASVPVLFRNLSPSRGGYDNESLEDAKKRAPRLFAVHGNAATSDDYSTLSSKYSHPVYGSVIKAVASVRTGIDADLDSVLDGIEAASTREEKKSYLLGNYVNRNIVELYILQDGDNLPIIPNIGLKEGLKTYLSDINVFTDELRVLDGKLKTVDIDATVVISRNAEASVVKENVLSAINDVFNIANRNMGEGFNRSVLITAIQNVAGVKSIDMYAPADDLPPLKKLFDGSYGVGIEELVVLGNQNVRFYLEQGNLNF